MTIMGVASVVIKLLITMILSRLLLPEQFGQVATIQIIISFAEIFWLMGVGSAIVQKKQLSENYIATGNTLNLILGLIIYVTIFVFASFIVGIVGSDDITMLRVLSIVFVIHSFSGVSEALLQKEMQFKVISIINTLAALINGAVAIILAFKGFGAWSLVVAQIISVMLQTVLSIIYKPIKFRLKIEKESAKELLNFGTGYALSKVFNNIASQGDYFVVSQTLGSEALGFYSRAYQLLQVPTNLIATVMERVLFPLLAMYQDEHEKIRYVVMNLTALIAILAFPITIVSLTMGADLVQVVLGPKWEETILPFKILIISLFFRMAYKIGDALVRSLGAVYKRLWVQIAYATLVIGGAYIGKEWGIAGVALTTTIAIIINYLIMTVLIGHLVELKLRELLGYLTPIIMVSIVIGGISYLISSFVTLLPYALVRLSVMTLAVGFMYIFAFKFVIIKYMPEDFRGFIKIIKHQTITKFVPKNKNRNN
ncbi:lipopolysaccharide biosynthesis protein [Acetobacterium wieringae]|uniref:lipopolysaccharide biosynthesis protein n=1 Tax=Acetobacterium wieringae TaxID=52694 RepID=UPI002B210D23|nr:lipopolysaccharide biosynthesis protein [Acetobacterium wieringae]MEA4805515.1 lipopolysaccharide biosynthesis protein [Acetobacterium wieringae]